MRAWLQTCCAKCPARARWENAIRCALTRWEAPPRYVDDGRIEIDNNAAERALRAVALGRKNLQGPNETESYWGACN
jgi:transposase